uniref:DUF4283 domain-containing protein n=1 Tax=Setaria viridis TaxID=4556 RepID=A0A4U6VKY5_SETVI|nr:hypothetical protein SEVIR_3G411800v2 [Setaria viridis]
MGPTTFLLRFGSPELRNSVLAMRALPTGNTGLRLMPWSKRARATVGSLRYRARVCLEGVPSHACHPDTVKQLFNSPSFIDEIDYEVVRDVERSCFNLWVWMADPNGLTKQAILKIEEPYVRVGPSGLPIVRNEAARTLDYKLLIHLDRVLDYAPLPNSPSHASYESDISGIPDEEPEEEWPVCHHFAWYPGVPDGERLPIMGDRVSVHARLGGTEIARRREVEVQAVLEAGHSNRCRPPLGATCPEVKVLLVNGEVQPAVMVVAGMTPAKANGWAASSQPHSMGRVVTLWTHSR